LLLMLTPHVHAASIKELTMPLPDGGDLLYALVLPDDYVEGEPRPLILALHPGGERMRYYGSFYARALVVPAAAELKAIIVAPDCPAQAKGWGDPSADRAVTTLLDKITAEHAIDRQRVLVTGFSMGGRGTWFMAAHHADRFTAAIPMAASVGDESVDTLATMPTYIIHSRADQVVPFEPAERNFRTLQGMGRPVKFEAVPDLPHFSMGGYVPSLRRAVHWVAERWNQRAAESR
jgi:predicted peptidase